MARWATNTGSTIIGSLNIDTIAWTSGSTVRYTFSGSPDLSGVVVGHQLQAAGCTNSLHNGTFEITAVSNVSDYIEVTNSSISDASNNESSSPGTGTAKSNAALDREPTSAKQGQGFLNTEKPPADYFNWLFKMALTLGGFFTLSEWIAEPHSGEELNLVKGQGLIRHDDVSTDEPGEGFILPDSGGLGVLEAAHPDVIAAMLSAFIPEILPPATASLDFGSTAQSAISTATVTVPGAQVGDIVSLGAPSTIEAGFLWSGFVSAANTVTIRLAKITTGTVDPAVGTWAVTVTRPNSMPVITTRGLKIFVNLMAGIYTSGTLETDLGIADNEAAFNLLVNSKQHRAAILDGGTIEAVISGSAIADAVILATGGY